MLTCWWRKWSELPFKLMANKGFLLHTDLTSPWQSITNQQGNKKRIMDHPTGDSVQVRICKNFWQNLETPFIPCVTQYKFHWNWNVSNRQWNIKLWLGAEQRLYQFYYFGKCTHTLIFFKSFSKTAQQWEVRSKITLTQDIFGWQN